ncbi:DMT family transporter [Roseitranquillus sediminis]|uniref:DMT family transporter n=1 Tax=Roseitranquillus sediminis TaxID=2809051 RepID=UPI001D0C16D9|nr:DMT family transporter [Roseitranquillus sediminis]MBM9593538.1 DMT family transporter [Roseitranquillus sediminis]
MPPPTDNLRGAALMTVSMAAFTINDTFMKSLSDELPLFQALLLRGIAVSILLAGAAWSTGALRMAIGRRDAFFIGLRTLGEIGAAYFFITALFNAPLANMTAILQALPLTVTLAGALFLREPIGLPRLVAIVIGFFGVLLIVRPGAAGFDVYALYGVAAVMGVTIRDLATRRISAPVPSVTVALAGSLGVALFAAVGATGTDWQPMSARATLQLGGSCLFLIAGYLLSVAVMRSGEIGFIAPFRYTGLVWALALGYLVFGDWPDEITLAGAGIVVSTGVFTLWRERRLRRRITTTAASYPGMEPPRGAP